MQTFITITPQKHHAYHTYTYPNVMYDAGLCCHVQHKSSWYLHNGCYSLKLRFGLLYELASHGAYTYSGMELVIQIFMHDSTLHTV